MSHLSGLLTRYPAKLTTLFSKANPEEILYCSGKRGVNWDYSWEYYVRNAHHLSNKRQIRVRAIRLRYKSSPRLIIQVHLGRVIYVQHPKRPRLAISDPPPPRPQEIPGPGWSEGIISSVSQAPHSYATLVRLIRPLCIYA